MTLTSKDLRLLKQLQAAGDHGRAVRQLNTRVSLDRRVKGGYLLSRRVGDESVQYRITQRGKDAILEHEM